jgi:Sec-independent protein translocase protein TatA
MTEEKISLHDERNDERLKDWWPLQQEHQTEVRSHFRWLFVLAGALSSFSMPLLAAQHGDSVQKTFIALALTAFLIVIVVGVCRMNWILRDCGSALQDLREGLTSDDQAALSRYRSREQKAKREKAHGDAYGTLVHGLFAAGTVLLIASVLIALARNAI